MNLPFHAIIGQILEAASAYIKVLLLQPHIIRSAHMDSPSVAVPNSL